MDHNASAKFYAKKAEHLTKLRDTLQLAVDELWQLQLDEERAPGGDLEEITPIFDALTDAHHKTNALLDAVKALAP